MTKVLIVTYYWPPSGGAGVQRWLKMSKYLAMQGVEVHIVTVDESSASYTDIDASLVEDVHPGIIVHKTKSIEPNNIYAKLIGKKKVPKAGFSNVDNASLMQKMATTIRSNFFIPDPRRPWNHFALKKCREVIKKYNIKNVITTSPPHSTQLIGLTLKKEFDIHWIADLRDPWTDIYYYDILRHTKLSHSINARLERKVIEQSDILITVSNGFSQLFQDKTSIDLTRKIHIITNGYDYSDFEKIKKESSDYSIVYTGTMSDKYNIEILFEALSECDEHIKLKLVGTFTDTIKDYVKKYDLNSRVQFVDSVSHSKVVKIQKDAMILLLVNPDVNKSEGILPGKLYEYLATGNPILALGAKDSDIEEILSKTNSGKLFDRNQKEEIKTFINNPQMAVDMTEVRKYSREYLAGKILEILK